MKKLSLSTSLWTLSATRVAPGPMGEIVLPAEVPATVPGSVHTDLLASDLIPDPMWGQNELGQFWIGQSDWRYRTTLPRLEGTWERVDLVCDGLDTIATLRLGAGTGDDRVIGSSDNMHRRHRFDVTSAFQAESEPVLTVDFESPVRAANRMAQQLRPRHHDYPHPYNAIRKMACSFGWDWGIATATSGIWRDIRLEGWSTARLAEVLTHARVVERAPTRADEGHAAPTQVVVTVTVERTTPVDLLVEASLGGHSTQASIPAGETRIEFTLDTGEQRLWWPVGHGEPVLHDLVVSLFTADGSSADDGDHDHQDHGGVVDHDRELDRVERRLGFRTVEWRLTPDHDSVEGAAGGPSSDSEGLGDSNDSAGGIGFTLHLNGRAIEVRGVNWIPDDPFPHRVTRQRLRQQFGHVLGANMNLVRIWGGGTYESEDFYDLADELGLLVWQDFTFACAAYAEEEPLFSTVIAEARDNVSRLAHRPSLVLFNGNNENLEGFQHWGWQSTLDGHTWGERYYYREFPAIVAELAPQVPYVPGSPWTPLPPAEHRTGEVTSDLDRAVNDPTRGTMHSWATWNRLPATEYRRFRPRFVAEYGWQAPPTWTTMQAFGDDEITPTSPGTYVHQKASSGNNNLTRGVLPNVALPTDLAGWHWALQWNQAEAIRLAIEWFRSLTLCTGNIVWQLNDCWPVVSWAAVDSAGRAKPLLHAMRSANSPRLLTLQPVGDLEAGGTSLDHGLRATVVNDTAQALSGPITVRRLSLAGEVLDEGDYPIQVPAWGSATVALGATFSHSDDPAGEFLVATMGKRHDAGFLRAWWWFAPPRDSRLAPARFEVEVATEASSAPLGAVSEVIVTARSLVRDLTLLADKANPDASVDSGMITLLPGESHTFRLQGRLTTDEARACLVTLNELVSQPQATGDTVDEERA